MLNGEEPIFIPKGIVAVKTQQAHKVVTSQPKKAEDFLKKLQTVNYDLKLGSNPTEEEVLSDMNAMAHQKIRAEQEVGHIPMIPSTVNQIYNAINKSNFPDRDILFSIAKKWENNNFSDAALDHDTVLKPQNGTVGYSEGNDTLQEEEEYALTWFSDLVK